MPDRHTPAIHIHPRCVQPQLLHHPKRLHAERFIQFIQINLIPIPPRPREHPLHSDHRSQHHPPRRNPTRSLSPDGHHHLQPQLLRLLRRHHHHSSSSIVHPRSIPRRHRPILLERRLQGRQRLHRSILPHTLVPAKDRHSPFLPSHINRNHLRIEPSLPPGSARLPMRFQRISILLLARNRMLLRHKLSRHAHVPVLARAPQPIPHHRVHHHRVAHAVTLASLRQKVRRIRHRLHPTRNDDLRRASHNALRRQRDRPQSAAAYHVDRQRRHRIRKPAQQSSLPRRILSQPRRQHASHHTLIDARSVNPRSAHGFPHHHRPKLHRGHLRHRALKLSHRRPHRGDNHHILHHFTSSHCTLKNQQQNASVYGSSHLTRTHTTASSHSAIRKFASHSHTSRRTRPKKNSPTQ